MINDTERKARSYWFFVSQAGVTVAKGCCGSKESAEKEANHYAMMYGQVGPVTVRYRTTTSRSDYEQSV